MQPNGQNHGLGIQTNNIAIHIIKIKIHSSCEIERFARNSSLQAVRDTPIARIYCVCALTKDIGRRLPLQLQYSLQYILYQGQQGD